MLLSLVTRFMSRPRRLMIAGMLLLLAVPCILVFASDGPAMEGSHEWSEPRRSSSTRESMTSASTAPSRGSNRKVSSRGSDVHSSHRADAAQEGRGEGDPVEADDLGQRVELPPQLPLVLRFDDADLLAHAPDVPVEVLDTIRDEFEGSIGSGTLDPSDPEYERKWKLAEPSADERYLTLFGWDAHADLVRRAAIQSMNNSKAPAAGEAR